MLTSSDFTTSRGEYSVGAKGSRKLLNSLIYKLAYYKFGKISTVEGIWKTSTECLLIPLFLYHFIFFYSLGCCLSRIIYFLSWNY